MSTGDDEEPEERAEELPEAPMKRPTVQEWMVIFGGPVAMCSVIALVLFRSSLYVLFAGKSATLTASWNCAGGHGVTAPAPSCEGSWEFPDGSTGSGTVHSASAGSGDTVLAAGDGAYTSLASVWSSVWFFFFLVAVSVVANTITWVNHYREDQRDRTRRLREPFEYVPGYRAFADDAEEAPVITDTADTADTADSPDSPDKRDGETVP
ncbi:hypothetical protein ACIBM4_00570 [Streptomyces sp. NPDC050256]|uniref:hypothetical protein n=1 Tax=Streptomyces sp. NPDC050256 TaxID=3365607 RepID=UPI00378A5A12